MQIVTNMGVKYLGFNILGADSVGAVFSGARLHLKAIKVCICQNKYSFVESIFTSPVKTLGSTSVMIQDNIRANIPSNKSTQT